MTAGWVGVEVASDIWQRIHGLPPDGEQAVPRRTASGTLDASVLYIAVPIWASPGSMVHVKIGGNQWDLVTVPPHLKAGDVMQLNVARQDAQGSKRQRTHDGDFGRGEGEEQSEPNANGSGVL